MARPSRASIGVLLIGGLLAACSGSGGGSAAGSGSGPQELVLGSYAGALQEGFTKCIVAPFEKKYNVKVKYQAGNGAQNVAIVAAQKNNPPIDVIFLNDSNEYAAVTQGVADTFDASKIPNLGTLVADEKRTDDYAKYFMPLGASVGGIEYNTKIFKDKGWDPPDSWDDLWDPKFKGHVAIISVSSTYTQEFLVQIAKMNGGSEKNLEPGFERLRALKPNLSAVYQTDPQMDQAFQEETAWLGPRTGARTAVQKSAGIPVDLVQPKVGTLSLGISAMLVKGAKNPAPAHQLMDYALSEEAQTCIGPDTGFGPVRANVPVSDDVKFYFTARPGQDVLKVDWAVMGPQLGDITKKFNEQVGGGS